MDFVFYNISPYAQALRDELLANLRARGKEGRFHCIEEKSFGSLQGTGEYLIFYLFSNADEREQLRTYMGDDLQRIKRVALCKTYGEGIEAIEYGNDYALKIPIEKGRVTRCINYFNQ